ncbi:hypothetical protein C8T65DRAFT_743982 [Cerioporus squamosus]|nr:hypothetical protein C8T65DRAFT_743982 [Cerioporus squamosus]
MASSPNIPVQPPPESTSRDALLSYISHETVRRQAALDQIQNELSQLRHLQNSLAPVNRLAPELFVKIFKYLVEPTIFKDESMAELFSPAARLGSLISATHVCYYWRQIALGAAELWTTIPLHNLPLALTFLPRSQSSPLDLDLVLPEKHDRLFQIIQDILLPQTPRLRTLILRVREYESLRRVVRKLRLAAPELEELLIWQIEIGHRERGGRDALPMADPSHPLFAGELPSLRTFSTHGVDIPLPLPAPKALVHLHIHNNMALSDKALIDLLAQCPGLQSLEVKEDIGFSFRRGLRTYVDGRRPVIKLPHLRCLKLEVYLPERAAALLYHIAVPSSTQFVVESSHDGFGIDAGYHMFPQNALEYLKFLAGIKRVEIFNTMETETIETVFVVRAYHDAASQDGPAVEIRARMAPEDLTGEFLTKRWPFDVSQVETFVVSGLLRNELPEDAWPTMLAEMDSVRTIRAVAIGQAVASDLASKLSDPPSDSGDRPFALCPALNTLELVDLSGLKLVQDNSLKAMVVARAAAGTLKELDLFNVTCLGPGADEVKDIKEKCGSSITLRVDEVD